ncbi:hypothetical protein KAU33_16660 [Candidatus Dependentiae bacterium]|nr:hypothetical protein [Candidatus Dependentiae bacterium]
MKKYLSAILFLVILITSSFCAEKPDIEKIENLLNERLPKFFKVKEFNKKPKISRDNFEYFTILLVHEYREYVRPTQQKVLLYSKNSKGVWENKVSENEIILIPEDLIVNQNIIASDIWRDLKNEYYTNKYYMGKGYGFNWFFNGNIYLQHGLPEDLALESGQDEIQILMDGLLVKDKGTMTRNSCELRLIHKGDCVIPYLQKAIKINKNNSSVYFAILGGINSETSTKVLLEYYFSGDTFLQDKAGGALCRRPYRESAKEAYLDMLENHIRIKDASEAAQEFNWTEVIPFLNELIENPKDLESIFDLRVVYEAKLSLEGNPVPGRIIEAEQILWQISRISKSRKLTKDINAAKEIILNYEDEYYILLIGLEMYLRRLKESNPNSRIQFGKEIILSLPKEKTKPELEKIYKNLKDDYYEDEIKKLIIEIDKK